MGKISSPIILFFIILLTIESPICCHGKNSSYDCIPGERKALLKFKESFVDPSNRLSSWHNYKDCCIWQGVECDKITGHVIEIDLRNNDPYSYEMKLHSNGLDSSLLELRYLSYLDLSHNGFRKSPIPAFLGSMKHLKYLDLSASNFGGVVPHNLGNLSSLRVLDLNYEFTDEGPTVDDLMWASNLSSLEHLDMSYVDLSQTKNLVKVLNLLPSLSVLRLLGSELDNTNIPHHTCVNSTMFANLKYLDLSFNSFQGEFPCFLQNMTSLRVLDLSSNQYNSSYHPHRLRLLRNLVHLNLYDNALHHKLDWISEFIWDKCHLKSLHLGLNLFYGEISGLFKNSSGCWIEKLEELTLVANNFHGILPRELGELKQLSYFDLSYNTLINGSIPSSLGSMRALKDLNLGYNQLSGEIPMSLGQLSNLEIIDISYNCFNTTLSEAHFARLSKLEIFLAASNLFIDFKVGLDWVPRFQLKYIYLQSSKSGGQFPQWLRTQTEIIDLSLSNCSISGTLPKWLQQKNLTTLHLSRNNIKGPIPDFLCEMKALQWLDLFRNSLSGNLPVCWKNFQQLEVMRLSSNELSGIIPDSIGEAYSLRWLHLNNNSLTGQLPYSLKNCTNLVFLDAGENKLSEKLPEWIGKYLLNLNVLRLRNNAFYDVIPPVFCQLSQLQIIDLASNKLTGNIPHCFGNFSRMVKGDNMLVPANEWFQESLNQVMKGVEMEYTTTSIFVVNLDLSNNNLVGEIPSDLTNLTALIGLNLSHNHLGGEIPAKIGRMESLISLDLSSNKLFGTIPDSLSDLSSLSHLNLSHNNLSGQIPKGNQLQTLEDPSMYDGNPRLCGAPLLKKCHIDEVPNVKNHEAADEEGDQAEKIYFYGVVISGFATGFWGIIVVLVFKRSWRQAYFRFIEVAVGKMLGW